MRMAAGYSKRSLVQKLGIKAGMKICILNAPEGYEETLGPLPEGVRCSDLLSGNLDFIHYFTRETSALERDLPELKTGLAFSGMLWLSWPKRTSPLATDLKESDVRALGLGIGLVDVKICAVDEDWSGLKFVYRVKDRK